MTDRNRDPTEDEEHELAELVAGALEADGELPPTTITTVARFEADDIAHGGPLPPRLASARARLSGVDAGDDDRGGARRDAPPRDEPAATSARAARSTHRPRRRPRAWLTHTAAAALGAAAAAALLVASREDGPEVGTVRVAPTPAAQPQASGTPPSPQASGTPPSPPARVGPVRECPAQCCGGVECARATGEARTCSSGRRCVGCDVPGVERLRVRLGSVAPSPEGRALVDAAKGRLELCVRAGASAFECRPAHTSATPAPAWSVFPLLVSAEEALAGIQVELRAPGKPEAVASWASALTVNAALLCRGVLVKPRTPDGAVAGAVSLFFDDTHYVEVGRAAEPGDLLAWRDRLRFDDVEARIFETRSAAERRFALAVGPLDAATARRVRWALVERRVEAAVTVGEDHVDVRDP